MVEPKFIYCPKPTIIYIKRMDSIHPGRYGNYCLLFVSKNAVIYMMNKLFVILQATIEIPTSGPPSPAKNTNAK